MKLTCWALIVMAGCSTAARADVFFEITRVGEAPDGFVTQAVIGEINDFDVWVWGTGADSLLKSVQFSLAGSPNSPNSEWSILTLGLTDPAGALGAGYVKLNGTLANGVITNAGVAALPPNLLTIGSSPATAFKIYGGFKAQNLVSGGLLSGTGKALNELNQSPTVQFIGVLQTPTPGALAVLTLPCGMALRRRRDRWW